MKNCEVAVAFSTRSSAQALHCSSTGCKMFSYSTCIAQWYSEQIVLFNTTHYSSTSTKHMYYVKKYIKSIPYVKVLELNNKPIPYGTQDLISYAKEQYRYL